MSVCACAYTSAERRGGKEHRKIQIGHVKLLRTPVLAFSPQCRPCPIATNRSQSTYTEMRMVLRVLGQRHGGMTVEGHSAFFRHR